MNNKNRNMTTQKLKNVIAIQEMEIKEIKEQIKAHAEYKKMHEIVLDERC